MSSSVLGAPRPQGLPQMDNRGPPNERYHAAKHPIRPHSDAYVRNQAPLCLPLGLAGVADRCPSGALATQER